MTHPDCPRLTAELAVLARSRYTTKADLDQRTQHHRMWCPCTTGWKLPRWLPRDPTQETT